MRDRDVRNTIQLLLMNTNAFDAVWLSGLPNGASGTASCICSALIEPVTSEFTPAWDCALVGGALVTSRIQVTFTARHADPQLRDELAELLLNTACNTLNGHQLGGLVIPNMSRFLSCHWQTPAPPERTLKADFSYQYLEAGWCTADVLP